MDHPDLIVCSVMENSIGLNRVKVKQKKKEKRNEHSSSIIVPFCQNMFFRAFKRIFLRDSSFIYIYPHIMFWLNKRNIFTPNSLATASKSQKGAIMAQDIWTGRAVEILTVRTRPDYFNQALYGLQFHHSVL